MVRVRQLFSELRRRKVLRTTAVYVALAWVLIQVADTLLPIYGVSTIIVRIIVGLIIAGLPVVILVSWVFDFTPGGLERDTGGSEATGPPGDSKSAFHEDLSRFGPVPVPPTPLVGREEEISRIGGHLTGDTRLVTLTGPGGTGKTRLAIAISEAAAAQFDSGVAYVDLTPVTDVDAVVPTIAGTLGVKESESRTLEDGLRTLLADLSTLLVLDNFEQVIESAPRIAVLLSGCPKLRLLVTSRVPLRISAETEIPIRPLELAPPDVAQSVQALEGYEAPRLFMQRARQARPDFAPGHDEAEAILEICRRLDGLPLALELAAARFRALDVRTILDRLEHALDFLTAGARDLPERQQTLRATFDWSHSLLDEGEQRIFRRLGVFVGGWTRTAAVAVCGEAGGSLPELESLVEKGLVTPPDSHGRYAILETLREYALERLKEAGEAEELRRRHGRAFLEFSREIEEGVRSPEQLDWHGRADRDLANLEEALAYWKSMAESGEGEAVEAGLEISGRLWLQWHARSLHVRSRGWTSAFLSLAGPETRKGPLAWASLAAGLAEWSLGNFSACAEHSQRYLPPNLSAATDIDPILGPILAMILGVTDLATGRFDQAFQWLDKATESFRELGSEWGLGMTTGFSGMVALATGDPDTARCLFEETLAHSGPWDKEATGLALGGLASIRAGSGDHEGAAALFDQALEAYGTLGDRPEEARVYDAYAWSRLAQGKELEARDLFLESLRAYEDVGSLRGIGLALLGLAATEAVGGKPLRALVIEAAALRFSSEEGMANDFAEQANSPAPGYLDQARAGLDVESRQECVEVGRVMTVRVAIRFVLTREEALAGD